MRRAMPRWSCGAVAAFGIACLLSIIVISPLGVNSAGVLQVECYTGGTYVTIPNGDTTPSVGECTEQGTKPPGSSYTTNYLYLHNTGDAALTINSYYFSSGGANLGNYYSSGYMYISNTYVSAGSRNSFYYDSHYYGSGTFNYNITLNTNVGRYEFTVHWRYTGYYLNVTSTPTVSNGISYPPATIPSTYAPASVSLGTDFGSVLSGSTVSRVFTLNTGDIGYNPVVYSIYTYSGDTSLFTAVLSRTGATTYPSQGGSPMTLTVSFVVPFSTTAGAKSYQIGLDVYLDDGSTYFINFAGTVTVEESYLMSSNNTIINLGSNTPSIYDGTDLGYATALSSTISEFTFANNETTDDIVISSITCTGPFVVSGQTSGTLGAGSPLPSSGSVLVFSVTFTPIAFGTVYGVCSISGTFSRTFNVMGFGTGFSSLTVKGNGNTIPTALIAPSSYYATDFGQLEIFTPFTQWFEIYNDADALLTITSITAVAGNSSDFHILRNGTTVNGLGGRTTFGVNASLAGIGYRATMITIIGSSPTGVQHNQSFPIWAKGVDSRIANFSISGPSGGSFGGGELASPSSDFNFPTQTVLSGSSIKTFTIRNMGAKYFTILGVTITSLTPANWQYALSGSVVGGSGGSVTLTITFNPQVSGLSGATISIRHTASNVPSPFEFGVQGIATSGVAQAVVTSSTGASIVSGSATTSVVSGTRAITTHSTYTYMTFTISNIGTGPLTILSGSSGAVSFLGSPDDWYINYQPSSTVAAGDSTTFQIYFITYYDDVWGLRPATCFFETSTVVYSFTVAAQILGGPILQVNSSTTRALIKSGNTPSTADSTDLLPQSVASYRYQYFRLTNLASSSSEYMYVSASISTSNPDDFYWYTYVSSSYISAGSSTQIQVECYPYDASSDIATVSITHNCADIPSPFTFNVKCNGLGPEVTFSSVLTGSTLENYDSIALGTIATGSTTTRAYSVANVGSGTLSVTSIVTYCIQSTVDIDGSTSTSIEPGETSIITFMWSPTYDQELGSCYLRVYSSDYNEGSFYLYFTGESVMPTWTLAPSAAPNQFISNPSPIVSSEQGTDFGDQAVSSNPTRSFVITNTGTVDLSTVAVTSSLSANFSIISQPSPTIAPGGSSTFVIQLNPYEGFSYATITVSIGFVSPHYFVVQGRGVPGPSMYVAGTGSNEIALGRNSILTIDGTDFGSSPVDTAVAAHTFTIGNRGNRGLSNLAVRFITGTTQTDFTLTAPSVTSLGPLATTTFTVTFTPRASGARYIVVEVTSSDSVHSPYTFRLGGWGAGPQIQVRGGSIDAPRTIISGAAFAAAGDGSDWGAVALDNLIISRTFTIVNAGDASMTVGSVTIGGSTDGVLWSVTKQPAPSLAMGESTTFTLAFDPVAKGSFSATVSIVSSDAKRNPFTFTIAGQGAVSPPGSPTGVSAVAGIRQATVSFTAPSNDGGSPIVDYTVIPVPSVGDGVTVKGTTSPIVFPGLNAGVAYSFIVVANNADTPGPYSVASNTVEPSPAASEIIDDNQNVGRGGKVEAVTVDNGDGFITNDLGGSIGILIAIIVVVIVIGVVAVVFRRKCKRPSSSTAKMAQETQMT